MQVVFESINAKLRAGLQSKRVKICCLCAGNSSLVVGVTSGSLYFFDHPANGDISFTRMYRNESISNAVSAMAMDPTNTMLAYGSSSVFLVVKGTQVLLSCVSPKRAALTSLCWSPDSSIVFSGYSDGSVLRSSASNTTSFGNALWAGETIAAGSGAGVVQLSCSGRYLLINTRQKSTLVDLHDTVARTVGKQAVRAGHFGGSHHPQIPGFVLCSRPGLRLWLVQEQSARVLRTLPFASSLDTSAQLLGAIPRDIEAAESGEFPSASDDTGDESVAVADSSSIQGNFSVLLPLGEYVVSWGTGAPLYFLSLTDVQIQHAFIEKGLVSVVSGADRIYLLRKTERGSMECGVVRLMTAVTHCRWLMTTGDFTKAATIARQCLDALSDAELQTLLAHTDDLSVKREVTKRQTPTKPIKIAKDDHDAGVAPTTTSNVSTKIRKSRKGRRKKKKLRKSAARSKSKSPRDVPDASAIPSTSPSIEVATNEPELSKQQESAEPASANQPKTSKKHESESADQPEPINESNNHQEMPHQPDSSSPTVDDSSASSSPNSKPVSIVGRSPSLQEGIASFKEMTNAVNKEIYKLKESVVATMTPVPPASTQSTEITASQQPKVVPPPAKQEAAPLQPQIPAMLESLYQVFSQRRSTYTLGGAVAILHRPIGALTKHRDPLQRFCADDEALLKGFVMRREWKQMLLISVLEMLKEENIGWIQEFGAPMLSSGEHYAEAFFWCNYRGWSASLDELWRIEAELCQKESERRRDNDSTTAAYLNHIRYDAWDRVSDESQLWTICMSPGNYSILLQNIPKLLEKENVVGKDTLMNAFVSLYPAVLPRNVLPHLDCLTKIAYFKQLRKEHTTGPEMDLLYAKAMLQQTPAGFKSPTVILNSLDLVWPFHDDMLCLIDEGVEVRDLFKEMGFWAGFLACNPPFPEALRVVLSSNSREALRKLMCSHREARAWEAIPMDNFANVKLMVELLVPEEALKVLSLNLKIAVEFPQVFSMILSSDSARSKQAALLRKGLEIFDSSMWAKQQFRMAVQIDHLMKSEQQKRDLPFDGVSAQQASTLPWFFEHSQGHWGAQVNLTGRPCSQCGFSFLERGDVRVFPCGHAVHVKCNTEEACVQCFRANFTSFRQLSNTNNQ